jgi:uncharacterized membrane protein
MSRSTLKDICLTAAAVIFGLLAVMGGGFADYAMKPFWWHFWSIAAWVGFIGFVGGWLYSEGQGKE